MFSIPTRYPNGLGGELPPAEFYEEEDAQKCLDSGVDPAGRERLIGEIKAFAAQLKSLFPIQKIYLYGSFARGEIHEGSDIDLVIVGDFEERFFERIGRILEPTDLPVEPLVYTPQEFETMKATENSFIEEVLKTGIEL